jgi:glycosyltransferase involved in cell wall biosynthesis
MISVLIPVYNYNVRNLINSIKSQLLTANIKFEIIIIDDASSTFVNENSKIKEEDTIHFYSLAKNIGRSKIRNLLVEKAKFDWLLFLDADVLPVNSNFIANYIAKMQATSKDIIAGNIIYDAKQSLPHLLRWKYGKVKEQKPLNARKNSPILNCRGANFAIKRNVASNFNFPTLKENYGFIDTRFFLQFQKKQVCVIENPVYHLGIEDNVVFLNKTKQAVKNAQYLLKNNKSLAMQIALISSYMKFRFMKQILAKAYLMLSYLITKNLTSKKPSITLFQIYKLLYLSYLDVSKDV